MKKALRIFMLVLVILAAFPIRKAWASLPAVEVTAVLTQDGTSARLLLELESSGPEPLSAFTLEITCSRSVSLKRIRSEMDSGLGTLKSAGRDGTVMLVFCDYTGGEQSLSAGKHAIATLDFDVAGTACADDFTVSAAGFANRLAEKVPVVCLPVREQQEQPEESAPSDPATSGLREEEKPDLLSSTVAESGAEGLASSQWEESGQPGSSYQEKGPEREEPESESESAPFLTGQASSKDPVQATEENSTPVGSVSQGDKAPSNVENTWEGTVESNAVVLPVQNRSAGWYFPVLLPALIVIIGGVVWLFCKDRKKKESDEEKE